MKRRFFAIIFFILFVNNSLFVNLNGCYKDFEKYQETMGKKEVEEKITKYLKFDSRLDAFYKITDQEFAVFASKEEKEKNNPEFVLRFGEKVRPSEERFLPNLELSKPLENLRIAIDPGHLGGVMSRLEERYVDLKLPDRDGHIQFDEGTLVTETAHILKAMLTSLGAEVFITRPLVGKAVYELSFEQWCEKEFGIKKESDWFVQDNQKNILAYISGAKLSIPSKKELEERLLVINNNNGNNSLGSGKVDQVIEIDSGKIDLEKVDYVKRALFRLCYNIFDLEARAEKINAFNPDITIIIHYNALKGSTDIVDDDYCLAFIPGGFMELSQARTRYEFVRLLVTDNLEESLKLSRDIVKSMKKELDVRLMEDVDYLDYVCHFLEKETGIYCRNLFLTRLVHSPICYGETLIQNYPTEALRIAKKDAEFHGEPISSRVIEVALAYFRGICKYFKLGI